MNPTALDEAFRNLCSYPCGHPWLKIHGEDVLAAALKACLPKLCCPEWLHQATFKELDVPTGSPAWDCVLHQLDKGTRLPWSLASACLAPHAPLQLRLAFQEGCGGSYGPMELACMATLWGTIHHASGHRLDLLRSLEDSLEWLFVHGMPWEVCIGREEAVLQAKLLVGHLHAPPGRYGCPWHHLRIRRGSQWARAVACMMPWEEEGACWRWSPAAVACTGLNAPSALESQWQTWKDQDTRRRLRQSLLEEYALSRARARL